MQPYFAYGSNMSRAVMARHAPDAVPLGIGKRDHWRFIIGPQGYGSIEPAPGHTIYGVVWNVTDRDLVGLDAYEEVETGHYHRRYLQVSLNDHPLRAITYIVTQPGTGQPDPDYVRLIFDAGRDWDLPFHYLSGILRWSPGREGENSA